MELKIDKLENKYMNYFSPAKNKDLAFVSIISYF